MRLDTDIEGERVERGIKVDRVRLRRERVRARIGDRVRGHRERGLRGERVERGIKVDRNKGEAKEGERVKRGIKVDRVRLDTDIGGEG